MVHDFTCSVQPVTYKARSVEEISIEEVQQMIVVGAKIWKSAA